MSIIITESLMSCTNGPEPQIYQRADPWVWAHEDGRYYFTAEYMGPDMPYIRGRSGGKVQVPGLVDEM